MIVPYYSGGVNRRGRRGAAAAVRVGVTKGSKIRLCCKDDRDELFCLADNYCGIDCGIGRGGIDAGSGAVGDLASGRR